MSNQVNGKTSMTIVGAGPVGALLAVILGRAGYRVSLFESRPDSRKHSIYQGKSINIAMSDRGWLALQAVGIDEQIRQQAIPMSKRVMHGIDGSLNSQNYGKQGQAIWSVSRSGINEQLLDLAENEATVEVFFEHRLRYLDFADASAGFSHKHGTGGSSGVTFLKKALDVSFFPELFEVRTLL
jgi:kynurenine 3-monooxygenase